MADQEAVRELEQAVAARDPGRIVSLWRSRLDDLLEAGPGLGLRAGACLVRMGESVAALEVLRELLRAFEERSTDPAWKDDVPARLLLGQALARSGATTEAEGLAERLVRERPDGETLGLRARLLKDRALQSEGAPRTDALRRAAAAYGEGHQRTGEPWHAINVASLSLLAGDEAAALRWAATAEQACQGLPADYWLLATLGEAALVRGELELACDRYRQASALARGETGHILSTWRNARLVAEHRELDLAQIDAALPRPRAIVFSGHMIDRPGRPSPRFPAELEPAVAAEIARRLDLMAGPGGAAGYAQVACGSDLLFLEALIRRGDQLRVVVPCDLERFAESSVAYAGTGWGQRFQAVLDAAADVIVASPQATLQDETFYLYANQVLLGLASAHARRHERALGALAVWDGRPGDGPGGTVANIAMWGQRGHEVQVVDLARLRGEPGPRLDVVRPGQLEQILGGAAASQLSARPPDERIRVASFLFGDAVKFSRLPEMVIPGFVTRFLGAVDAAIRKAGCPTVYCNTWGDGLFLAFADAQTAARAALAIVEAVGRLEPEAGVSLPGLRVGLHAGPVFLMDDPVTRRPTLFGTQITRAARIEPIVPDGQVYASELFVALMGLEGGGEVTCEPVGSRPLAKGYGREQLYHVRRASGLG